MNEQTYLFVADRPVGIESRVQDVIRQLNSQQTNNDVALLGIWGMAGVGKTAIASALYNKMSRYFEEKSFISDVSKVDRNGGLVSIQKQLLALHSGLRNIKIDTIESGKMLLKQRLSGKKILLVLDDVDNEDQLRALCGSREWFGPGSRIIIITRDRHPMRVLGVDHVYRVKELDHDESLELFSWHAFKDLSPRYDFVELSRDIVYVSQGLPLALIVSGLSLFGMSSENWKVALERLKRVPYKEVQQVLRASFDQLDLNEQNIFLDIACFFVGMDLSYVIPALDNAGYFGKDGIARLEDMCFIEIDENNMIRMHILMQQMGRHIIQSESQHNQHQPKLFEVFLSFRGEDTRALFISHLYASLQNAGIHVFKDDDEIQRGEKISFSLLRAIASSRIAIVVLSRNYANSRWCMKELENVMENCITMNLVVVPVFYGVDPSDVRNQKGEFGKAFNDLITRISPDERLVMDWKNALLEVGSRAGFVIINPKNEYEDIKNIVEKVTGLLDKEDLVVAEYPVGVESRVQQVIQKLNCQQCSNNVLLLGIWGMGGIGKTTIAKAIYNKVRRNFEAKSFLLNVREVWEQNNGQVSLQERLLHSVYKTTKIKIDTVELGKTILKERLQQKRIFLVLDDVNKLDQLSALCGSRKWFGRGSRIIITTRDEDLLLRLEVDFIYKINEMEKHESLELFSWHAFKQPIPREGFLDISSGIVDYCKGLPLALQVIGSFLSTKHIIREWKSVFDKLKVIPNDEVLKRLRISFDGLCDYDVKEIFLDIAFFFIGMDRDDVIEILNDIGRYAEIGISVLLQQSLITIDNKNRIGMHDLLRDMGREIVREKSPEVAEKRSRLWQYEDVLEVLSKDIETTTIKGLTLKLPTNDDTPTYLETKAFEKMKRLRLLQFAGIQLDGNYRYLSRDITWLCWHGFPSRCTPANFHQGSLVAIDLRYSYLEQAWKTSQVLKKLKLLNLSHSPNLKQTPDFSKLPNLEKLILKDCSNLSLISPTIGDLKKILLINLKNCTKLCTLPRSIYKLKSLKTLILSGCSKIEKLEEDLEQMESLTTLIADKSGITRVPFAVVRSKSIAYISLCGYEGFSRDVFPSLVRSWMSPTNSVLSLVRTFAGVPSLALLDEEQNTNFYGLSSIIKDLQKLQRIWVKCDSEVQVSQNVERIMGMLSESCEEFEATPSISSQVRNASSKNSFASLLIQIGMNCHITDILREGILQKMSSIGACLLPSDNYPNWLTFNGEGSSVVFEVPGVNGHYLKTLMCIVYYSSPNDDNISTKEGLKNVLVINYTKNTIQLYKRDALTFENNDDEWQKVVSNIEPGNKVRVVVVFGGGFTVKKTTIYLVYNELIDKIREHPHKADKKVIAFGGDGNIFSRLFTTLASLVQAALTNEEDAASF